jgi:hypothetical protein
MSSLRHEELELTVPISLSHAHVNDKLKEALIKWLFSTVRGSGWPGLKGRYRKLLLLESRPSATANGTE